MYCPAHNVNKPSPAVQHVWFVWHRGLGRSFMTPPLSPPPPIRDFSSPQCQPNQTYCTAGECLLTWCAGPWARARACHWNRKKK